MVPTPLTIPALCFDLESVARLMKATSYAQAIADRTTTEWVPDEGAMGFLYGALGGLFGTPGNVEIQTNWAKVNAEAAKHTERRMQIFFKKCFLGPTAVTKYLADTEELRLYGQQRIREIYADTDRLNKEVTAAWGVGIERLANTKLAATLLVKGLGQIPGPPMLVDIGFDIVVACVEPGTGDDKGQGVAVRGRDAALGEALEYGTSKAGEKLVDAINRGSTQKEFTRSLSNLNRANERLHRQVDRLARRQAQIAHGMGGGAAQQSAKALTRHVKTGAKTVNKLSKRVVAAGAKAAAAKAVGWLWLGSEIITAVEERQKAVAAARQGGPAPPPKGPRLTR